MLHIEVNKDEAAKEANIRTEKDHEKSRPGMGELERPGGEEGQADRDKQAFKAATDSDEIIKARQNAWSFPGLDPPNKAEEIGREELAGDTFIYYKDELGTYWYNTESTINVEKEMQGRKSHKKSWR